MLLVIPRRVLFCLSTTPFCWGEYGAVKCLEIPFVLQYVWNSFDTNSPPISVLNVLRTTHVSCSTIALNFLNLSNASLFSLSSIVHMYWEWL